MTSTHRITQGLKSLAVAMYGGQGGESLSPNAIAAELEITVPEVIEILVDAKIYTGSDPDMEAKKRGAAVYDGAVEDYQLGMPVWEIVAKWHINTRTFYAVLDSKGVPKRGFVDRYSAGRKRLEEDVIELYAPIDPDTGERNPLIGMPLRDMRMELGISVTKIYKIVHGYGLPLRMAITAKTKKLVHPEIVFEVVSLAE